MTAMTTASSAIAVSSGGLFGPVAPSSAMPSRAPIVTAPFERHWTPRCARALPSHRARGATTDRPPTVETAITGRDVPPAAEASPYDRVAGRARRHLTGRLERPCRCGWRRLDAVDERDADESRSDLAKRVRGGGDIGDAERDCGQGRGRRCWLPPRRAGPPGSRVGGSVTMTARSPISRRPSTACLVRSRGTRFPRPPPTRHRPRRSAGRGDRRARPRPDPAGGR